MASADLRKKRRLVSCLTAQTTTSNYLWSSYLTPGWSTEDDLGRRPDLPFSSGLILRFCGPQTEYQPPSCTSNLFDPGGRSSILSSMLMGKSLLLHVIRWSTRVRPRCTDLDLA